MKKWFTAVVAVAVIAFTGCSGDSNKDKSKANVPGKGVLKGPGDTTIKQDGTEAITVTIKRPEGNDEDVKFTISGLPEGVKAEGSSPFTIPKGETKTKVTLKADKDAKPITNQEVEIKPEGGHEKAMFKLSVKGK